MKIEIELSNMPAEARLWVFGAERELDTDSRERLLSRVDDFLGEWNAHGHPVVGAAEMRHDRFLIIAADEEATGVSGCSIDSLYRVLKMAEREVGVVLLDSSLVFYRDAEEQIHAVSRAYFRRLVADEIVGADTTVFDNTVASVGALQAGDWEGPMRESWHAAAFPPRA